MPGYLLAPVRPENLTGVGFSLSSAQWPHKTIDSRAIGPEADYERPRASAIVNEVPGRFPGVSMRRIQWYVLRELAWPIVASLFFLTVLLVVSQLFKETDILLQTGVSGNLIFQLMGVLMMSLLTVTVPMAILLATLIGFGRLATEREVLAIRAAGLNLWSIFWPVIVAAGVVTVVLMVINATYVPSLFARVERLRNDIIFEGLYNLQPGTFNDLKDSNLTIYYERRVEEKGPSGIRELGMRDIALRVEVEQDNEEHEILIFAERGTVAADPASRSIELSLQNGVVLPINRPEPNKNTALTFGRLYRALSREERIRWDRRIRQLSLSELFALLETERPESEVYRSDGRIRNEWKNYYRLYNEIILRFSLPVACLAFVVLGMPLAVVVRPGAKSVSFLITFSLMFLYYMVLSWGRGLGEVGNPVGWVLILSPNVVLAIVGAVLMVRTIRR